MTSPADDIDVNTLGLLEHRFVSTAIEYYVSARFAFLELLVNVGGNLCHHAVEMLLKAHLVKKHALEELSNRPFGHKLPHLWRTFKAEVAADLGRFDETINELHKFEELRYPDPQRGSIISLVAVGPARRARPAVAPDLQSRTPRYELGLEEFDGLVAAIFKAASINDRAYFPEHFRSGARRYLYKLNKAMREVDP